MTKHLYLWYTNEAADDSVELYVKDPTFVIRAERCDLALLKELEEASRAGIYILSDGGHKRYVGQASTSVLGRLRTHEREKPWWTEVTIFGRVDGRVDRSQLDYLEAKLIASFKEGNFEVDNGTVGNRSHIESYSKAGANSLLADALRILEETVKVPLLKASKRKASKKASSSVESEAPEVEAVSMISSPVASLAPSSEPSSSASPASEKVARFILTDGKLSIEGPSRRRVYHQWLQHLAQSEEHLVLLRDAADRRSRPFYSTPKKKGASGIVLSFEIAPEVWMDANVSTKRLKANIDLVNELLDVKGSLQEL